MDMLIIALMFSLNVGYIFWNSRKVAAIESELKQITSSIQSEQRLKATKSALDAVVDNCKETLSQIQNKSAEIITAPSEPTEKRAEQGNRKRRTPEQRRAASEKAKARWALRKMAKQQVQKAQTALNTRGSAL